MVLQKVMDMCLGVELDLSSMDSIIETFSESSKNNGILTDRITFDSLILMEGFGVDQGSVLQLAKTCSSFELAQTVKSLVGVEVYEYYLNLFEIEYAATNSALMKQLTKTEEELELMVQELERVNESVLDKI